MVKPHGHELAPFRFHISHRRGLVLWPYALFMLFFAVFLGMVCRFYLLPAMDGFSHADKAGQRLIGVHALLVLTVVLLILALALLLTFRVSRYFTRTPVQRTPTKYVDAWTESAKRMKTPPEE